MTGVTPKFIAQMRGVASRCQRGRAVGSAATTRKEKSIRERPRMLLCAFLFLVLVIGTELQTGLGVFLQKIGNVDGESLDFLIERLT